MIEFLFKNHFVTEAVIVIVLSGGIATIARKRGGNAVLWGGIAAGGYLGLRLLTLALGLFESPGYEEAGFRLGRIILPAAWLVGVGCVARFVQGRGRGAGESWFCRSCGTLNTPDASHCEACGREYQPKSDSLGGAH